MQLPEGMFFPTCYRLKGDTSCVLVSPPAWAMLAMQFVGQLPPLSRFFWQPGMLCLCLIESDLVISHTHTLCWFILLDWEHMQISEIRNSGGSSHDLDPKEQFRLTWNGWTPGGLMLGATLAHAKQLGGLVGRWWLNAIFSDTPIG